MSQIVSEWIHHIVCHPIHEVKPWPGGSTGEPVNQVKTYAQPPSLSVYVPKYISMCSKTFPRYFPTPKLRKSNYHRPTKSPPHGAQMHFNPRMTCMSLVRPALLSITPLAPRASELGYIGPAGNS